jgi:hypothetical protein
MYRVLSLIIEAAFHGGFSVNGSYGKRLEDCRDRIQRHRHVMEQCDRHRRSEAPSRISSRIKQSCILDRVAEQTVLLFAKRQSDKPCGEDHAFCFCRIALRLAVHTSALHAPGNILNP